jgi:hypothetical protein
MKPEFWIACALYYDIWIEQTCAFVKYLVYYFTFTDHEILWKVIKINLCTSNMVQKEETGILDTNMEFVDGWTLAQTLGEGAYGEWVPN